MYYKTIVKAQIKFKTLISKTTAKILMINEEWRRMLFKLVELNKSLNNAKLSALVNAMVMIPSNVIERLAYLIVFRAKMLQAQEFGRWRLRCHENNTIRLPTHNIELI